MKDRYSLIKVQHPLNKLHLMVENKSMPSKKLQKMRRVVFIKGEHQWRFQWHPGDEINTVKAITAIAKSIETDFDWFDAAMVCHEMSKITANKAA